MKVVVLTWDPRRGKVRSFVQDGVGAIVGLPETPLLFGKRLPQDAFQSVKSVDLRDTGNLVDIPDYTFANLRCLGVVHLNSKTKSIGCGVFWNCSKLTTAQFPDSLRSIGYDAFNGCSSITTIHIPPGVSSIGGRTFRDCSKLTSLCLPNGITSIGDEAFVRCHGLIDVWIPSEVISIGKAAFCHCACLRTVHFPQGLHSLGDDAFASCGALTIVVLPLGLRQLGSGAFCDCQKLRAVFLSAKLLVNGWSDVFERTPVNFCVFAGDVGIGKSQRPFVTARVCAERLAGEVIEGKKVFAPVDEDWRLLGMLERCPLEE